VKILGLTGVYHADGGLRGELAYALGRLRGTAHCGLCDITHRGIARKREWDRLRDRLGVPVELVHLNERSEETERATAGRTPCILARTDGGYVLLLGPAELDAAGGDVAAFAAALHAAADAAGLEWPSSG